MQGRTPLHCLEATPDAAALSGRFPSPLPPKHGGHFYSTSVGCHIADLGAPGLLQRPDNGGETPIDVAVRNEHHACAALLTDALDWPQLISVGKGQPRTRSSHPRATFGHKGHGKGTDMGGLPSRRFQPGVAGNIEGYR